MTLLFAQLSLSSDQSDLDIPISSKIHRSVQREIAHSNDKIDVLVKKKDIPQDSFASQAGNIPIKQALPGLGASLTRETNDFISVKISPNQLEALAENSDVEKIYNDFEYESVLDFSVQLMNAESAWNLGLNGSGIKVAILDTGIDYNNPAFQDRVILSEVFTDEDHTDDRDGHGTHVAGVVAGNGQLRGIAPSALILNGKVLTDSGSGRSSTLIAGIEWAIQNQADVISMSLGRKSGEQDTPVNEVIQEAIDNGIVVIVAAGNCGPCRSCNGFSGVTAPGNYRDAITVGAIDDDLENACFSSGQDLGDYLKPDLVAPGVNIRSYYIDNRIASLSGTSMATPHISGVAALLKQHDPSLTHYEIKSILEENAIDLGTTGKDSVFGSGLVDIEIILPTLSDDEVIQETPSTPDIIISDNRTNSTENNTIDEYEGYYVTVPVNLIESESLESAGYPNEVTIKIRNSNKQTVVDTSVEPIQTEELIDNEAFGANEYEPLGNGRIDYDDDFTHAGSSGDDGIAWGGSYLDVGMDGEEWDAQVICYDWCDDGTWDHCFGESSSAMQECYQASSWLYDRCVEGKCYNSGFNDDHQIGTGSRGQRWKCNVDVAYYRSCGGNDYIVENLDAVPYYIVSPRQYQCENDNTGGDIWDIGYFSSGSRVIIESGIDCPGSSVCDEGRDDSSADFGSYGTSTPTKPCSYYDGDGDCDGGDCFSGSYCDEAGFTDRCCPIGTEWRDNACRTICYDNSYSACYDNDVYWYNSCNERGSQRYECGSDSCGSWGGNYCGNDGNIHRAQTCHDRGCSSNNCFDDTFTNTEIVQNCDNGCSGSSCITCDNHAYKACYNNDLYWYDSCNNRQDRYQDCQNPNSVCAGDGTGRYYNGFCHSTDRACYYSDFESCNDCSGGSCAHACELLGAWWSTSSTTETTQVTLNLQGDIDCVGDTAGYSIWEVDCGYDHSEIEVQCTDDPVTTNPSSSTFNSNAFTTSTWIAEWQNDGIGVPEYYFIGSSGGDTIRSDTPDLEVQPCNNHAYKACYNNDIYWYNSCNVREEIVENCQNPASTCTDENGGGRYYNGFCDTNTVTCYYADFEACNDCSNGICAHNCDITNAYWSPASTTETSQVTLHVTGDSDCNGLTASYNIWELDCLYDHSAIDTQADCTDESVNTNPSSSTFRNGATSSTWTAEWQADGGTNPEYYFVVAADGQTYRSSTPNLEVDPCGSHAYTACYNNDLYYYDGCNRREEKADDCQDPPSICTDENGGGRYYDGFCHSADRACYYNEFETCNDCSGGTCSHDCELLGAWWSDDRVTETDQVTLNLQGDIDCVGDTAGYTIWEVDCLYDHSSIETQADCDDEPVQTNPSASTFNNGAFATSTWTAEWQNDGIGVPEYYFIGSSGGETLRSDTPDLEVDPCGSHAYTACYNNDLYYYDGCNRREEKADDCQDPPSICTDENGGGSYYNGFCDTNDNVCYYADFEGCNDCTNGACLNQCDMSDAWWSTNQEVLQGTEVSLYVQGDSDCINKELTYNIWEADCGYDHSSIETQLDCTDEPARTNPAPSSFNNARIATTNWISEYQPDGIGIPEYYFIANENGNTLRSRTPDLEVRPCEPNKKQFCYENKLYWYDSCNVRGDVAKDCPNLDPICTPDNGGGRYHTGYCDTELNDCFFADFEACNDCNGGVCSNNCEISNAWWSTDSANGGDIVTLYMQGDADCNGKTATYNVWEKDCGYDHESIETQAGCADEAAINNPEPSVFSNGQTSTSWVAEYSSEGGLDPDPEYYFIGNVEGSTTRSSTPDLDVQECIDQDCSGNNDCGDGNCQPGEECPEDCLRILGFENPPDSVEEGEQVQIGVRIKNLGTVTQTANAETGIVPTNYPANDPECCNQNGYYHSGQVSIDNGQTTTYNFNIQTPTQDSTDNCGNKDPWGDSFVITAGLYNSCNGDYFDSLKQEVGVVPKVCNNNTICDINENNENCPSDCPCNFNYECDPGETEANCDYDCGCNGDKNCDTFRDETSANCPSDCVSGCDIPDGSSWECECDSDANCPDDYFCNQIAGPDPCDIIDYNDECSNYNDYFCEEGWVKQCVNNGDFYEKNKVENCNGKFTYCDPIVVDGTGECSRAPNNLDAWIDFADTGVLVYKQPGDKIRLNIYSEQSDSVYIEYDTVYLSDNCLGTLNLNPGINSCDLQVNEYSPTGRIIIKTDNKESHIKISESPEYVIITDSVKLKQRYPAEESGVDAILKQAYQNAEKDRGMVYDLSQYNNIIQLQNPFTSFRAYNEKITEPSSLNKAYHIRISDFTRAKCKYCKDVMIIGDDFVVPHLRRNISKKEIQWVFFPKRSNQYIYTDTAFSGKSMLQFNNYFEMFKIDGKYEGKNVKFVVPGTVTTEMRTSIDNILGALNANEYFPDINDEVNGGESICYNTYWTSDLKSNTLIIIGTEETNNIFNCMAFTEREDHIDGIYIQPNPLDTDEYAIVINSDDPAIVNTVAELIEGKGIVELRGHGAYVFHMGTQYVGYGSLILAVGLVIAGTGGTAAPVAAGMLGSLAAIAEVASDLGDITDTCFVNNDGLGWCGGTALLSALPMIPAGKVTDFLKKISGDDIVKRFGSNLDTINRHFEPIMKNFDANDLGRAAKNEDDIIQLARGGRFIDDEVVGGIDNFYPRLPAKERLRLIKKIGRYSDDFLNNGWKRFIEPDPVYRGVKGSDAMKDDVFKNGVVSRGNGDDFTNHIKEGTSYDSKFISASKDYDIAARKFASDGEAPQGFVFKINPRARNTVDAIPTLRDHGFEIGVEPRFWDEILSEREVAFIKKIDPQDIQGAWKVDRFGNIIGDFIPNNNYVPDIIK